MEIRPKLTTKAACRVARIDRDRFNEHVAAGRFECAPETIPGRARLFDPDHMIALVLFRDLLDDGFDADRAGKIACAVAQCARENPEADAISFVQTDFTRGLAVPADEVEHHSKWDGLTWGGSQIRKVTTFRIGLMRKLIAYATEEQRQIIGEDD